MAVRWDSVFFHGTQIVLVDHGISKQKNLKRSAVQVEMQKNNPQTIMQINLNNSPLTEVSGHQGGIHFF